jgi:lipopolysaccharide/colanic/teichoic acid biosynthesis glycosyltransferase
MVKAATSASASNPALPTIWGLDPLHLHGRYWASRGVQVVRRGEPSELVHHAELYLLTDRDVIVQFSLVGAVDRLSWLDVDVLLLRLADSRERGYREHVLTDSTGRFTKVERMYGGSVARHARVALTTNRDLALAWQAAASDREAWLKLRGGVPRRDRWTMSLAGRVYVLHSPHDLAVFTRDLVRDWQAPSATINRITEVGQGSWALDETQVDAEAKLVGRVWVGAGRKLSAGESAVGPAVMWDVPASRPVPDEVQWLELEPSKPPEEAKIQKQGEAYLIAKRAFDLVFALTAILCTLPFYPIILAMIWLEDRRPFFFVHMRETKGEREFGCIKFRSMRRDAEKIKQQLQAQNKADGPQFFIEDDPRMTKVGNFLRKYQIDEWPQFFNVLLGDMSVVGPRPSPRKENQFCPPWREARLSVKPGVTGLWQVKRTRVAGKDFQEWIKYDIQYVEQASFWFDLQIIWKTVMMLVRGVTRS